MTKIKSLLAFVALMLCGGAWAGVDETGVQPTYWWTFDGGNLNGDSRAVATKGWSGGGDGYVFSDAGKAVKGGDPYINNNGLNHSSWTETTDFTLVGSFRINLQERGNSTANKSKAMLFGIGWNNTCYGLAADSSKVYLMWNSSNVSYTGSAAKGSLSSAAQSFDLTKGFHSYALVVDRTNSKLYVYVDGNKVLEQSGVTVSHLQNAGILSMPGGDEESNIGAARTKTMCDDYRIYTSALSDTQLTAIAATKYAVDGSGNSIDMITATVNGDAAIDALTWSAAYNKAAKIVLNGSGKVTTTSDTMPTGQVVVGEGVELVYVTNTTAIHSGSGTVTFSGIVPNNNAHDYFADGGLWTGTVKISNKDNGTGAVNTAKYSNYNSTICLNGTSGYLGDIWNNGTSSMTVYLEDYGTTAAWTQKNGGSSQYQKFTALKGTGTWKAPSGATQTSLIGDASEFYGSFDFSVNTCINIGGTAYADANRGYIIVAAGKEVSICKLWKPTIGLKLDGIIKAKGGTLGANTTFGDSATIDVSAGDLTLSTGKSVTFGTSINLVGVSNGDPVIKGVNAAPANLNIVSVSVNGKLTEDQLVYDADQKAIVYKTTELSLWAPNPAALENNLLIWDKENAWLDEETPKSWSAAPEGQDVKIDAASVSGVVIAGQIAVHDVYLVNTSDFAQPFEFHNSLKTVDGNHEVNDGIDCLTANTVVMTGYNGKLGLKVPIKGEISLGNSANLTFATGTADGAASKAYAYQFAHIGTIAVEGDGKFEVPESMYNVSFSPASSATIVYNIASGEKTATTTFGGTGTIMKTGAGTLTLTTDLPSSGVTLTAAEGTLKFGSATQYGSAAATINVLKGATFVSNRDCDSWHFNTSGIAFNVYGILDMGNTRLNINNGQTWNIYAGAEIKGTGQGNNRAFDYADASGDATFRCHADPTRESTEIKWNVTGRIRTRNPIFDIDAGVTVVLGAEQYNAGNNMKITKKGAGTLKLTSAGIVNVEMVVEAGLLDLSELSDGSAVLKGNLTIGENGIVKFPAGEFVACAGTLTGISSSVMSDGNGGLVKVTVNGATVSTESIAASTAFDKPASYWKNIYVGPAAEGEANASELAQWIVPTGTALPPLASNSNRWQPALFDGTLMVNVDVVDGYKNVPATMWEGWQLQVGLVNGAKVTVAELVKIQDTQGVGCFIGVDSTSKLVVSKFNNGSHNGTIDFDIAAPEGLVVANEMRGNSPNYLYVFRGNGSIKVDGAFNSGASHKVKYVEISADEIGEGGEGKYKVRKYRKLIGFTSSTLTQAKVSFASDATVKVGDADPSAELVRGDGEELNALDPDGTAKIVINPAGMDPGIYVQYIGYSETRPSQYQWIFDPDGDSTDTTDNWSGTKNWKGIVAGGRRTTWNDNQVWREAAWREQGDANYNDYINYANDITFYFDAAVHQTVSVDYAVKATLENEWEAGSGIKPGTTETHKTSTRLIKVVNTGDTAGVFKFNLPAGDKVDSEGAPLAGFNWSTAAEVSAPIDATGFNGELGLRAKLTGPITLGPNAKVVFVKPDADETIAYPYSISGNGTIEVRGSGKFIVPSNMTGVAFEITAGDDASAGAIIYDVPADETMTVTAAITGAGAVIKRGEGTLVLPPTCSFTGGLTVKAGNVKMNAPSDSTRIDSIVVEEGATFTFVVSEEQIETGYNASNVTGNLVIVDANGTSQAANLLPNNILRGTKNIWKHGVINDNYITSTAMAVLYDLHVAEVTGSEATYTLSAKLGGGSVNRGTPVDATIVVADTVADDDWFHIQIQVVDDGHLKIHEIAIKDGKDETNTHAAILAKSIKTGYVTGGSVGTFVTEFTGVGEDYKTVYLRADAHGIAAKIGDLEYPTVAKAISVAKAGDVVKLQAAYSSPIAIPEGVTVDVNGQTFTGTVSGSGTIKFAAVPTDSNILASLANNTWSGTVKLSGLYLDHNNNTLNNLGNANSKVELEDCRGYFRNGHTYTIEVVITGTMTQDSGYSNNYTIFNKISGTGKILSGSGKPTQNYYFVDASGFTGDIDTQAASVYFGADDNTHNRSCTIIVGANNAVTVSPRQVWKATNGVTVNGTLDFRGTDGTQALVDGDMTVGDTAGVRFPADWPENAGLKLCTGTLIASNTDTIVPIAVGDYAFKAFLRYDPVEKTVSYRTGSKATPIAFWKGDFKTTSKCGVTLSLNGNTVAADENGSTVTIESDANGITFDFDKSITGIDHKATVLVKYSALSKPASEAKSLLFSYATETYNRDILGAYLTDAGSLLTMYDNNTYNGGSVEGKPTANGMLAATISLTAKGSDDLNGPVIYIKDATSSGFTVGRDAHGVYVSNHTIKGFAIGGPRSSTNFSTLGGMKIEAVAVFDTDLTVEDMDSFHWGFDGEDPMLVWQGENDADISAKANWTGATEDTVLAEYDLIFPATTEPKGVTVNADVACGTLELNGEYTLKGNHVLTVNSLKISEEGSLRLETGVTLNFVSGISTEALKRITFAGGQITSKKVPHFTQEDDIVVDQSAYTTQGGHKLISWTDFMKVGEYGYGMPKLNSNAINPAAVLTTHTETIGELDWGNGSKARLLGMVGEIFLEVRSAEQLARKPIRILPLGDSITEGYNGSGNCANYRTQLAAKLSMAGYMVETLGYHYVRSRMPSGEWAPIEWQYHAGVSAQRVWTSKSLGGGFNNRAGDMEAIEATLNVCDGEPDIVLVKLGTNDIGNGDPADHIYDGLKKTLNKIHDKFPNAKVIVTTAVKYGTNNGIRNSYNTLIRNAFKTGGELATAEYGWLSLVDQCVKVGDGTEEGSFNDAQGRVLFYSDSTHPDWAGHDLMSDGWYEKIVEIVGMDAGKDKAPKAACTLGAKANVPAEYLDGFVRVRQLDIAEEAAYPQSAFTGYTWSSEKTVTDIQKVGYFLELVRKDNGAHTFVWVDMDKFGDTIADLGLPTTATHQQVVNNLHVYSNLGSVHNVAATDDTVKGYIEFSPFNSTCNALSGAGVPTKLWDAMDWNDTFATSGAGRGAMQVHRVKKEGDELWNGGEVIFAYNNWGSANTGAAGTKAGEIGIGNFCQHYMTDTSTNGNGHEINARYGNGSIGLNNNQISVDYTATRFSPVGDRVNAKAYEVKRLEIWVKGTVDSDAEDPVVITTIPEAGIEIKPDDDVKVTVPQDSTATAVAAKISVKYTDANGTTTDLKTRGYVTVAVADNGAVTVAPTEAAKPDAVKIKMTLPKEGEGEGAKDKVSFTITDPIPGLFYSIVSADDPAEFDKQSGEVKDSIGTQATGSESTTTSIDMPTDAKVKYFRVRVKATK